MKSNIHLKLNEERMKKRIRKYSRKRKIRKILGLPPKNEFISPGVYTSEFD
jgi:hypothetical protein